MINFAVFIVSHGRPDDVITYNTLKKRGYTGPIFIILDNLDNTASRYKEIYGQEKIIVFDKYKYTSLVDCGDNFGDLRSTTHVRNACFDIAKDLGFTYFLVLDDDYGSFRYRFDQNLKYKSKMAFNLDKMFLKIFEFLKSSKISCIAMAQGGDFIGGDESDFAQSIETKRKIMNSFFCSTESRFSFLSRLNEDVNTYLSHGQRGLIFLTTNQVSLDQKQTQSNPGGMTETYLENGTYVKSFYSVMYSPSSCKVSILRGNKFSRIHHAISWKYTVPMILRENHRKD
jgi:hypothetical protein